jgi:hypothetical protein
MTDDTLVYYGSEVKALDGGRFGGRAVVFGDETKTDLSPYRDYMTAETDYWVDDDEWGQFSVPIVYNHGLDPELKRTRLGLATFTKSDDHLWAEGQLKLRDAYEKEHAGKLKAIMAMIADGRLGLSTGVPGHLVEREKVGEAHWLKSWPVRIAELSLTPTPAEPRTSVVALKSLTDDDPPPESVGRVKTLQQAASVLRWAKGCPDLNAIKAEAIDDLHAAWLDYRNSRRDPVKDRASRDTCNRLLSLLKG